MCNHNQKSDLRIPPTKILSNSATIRRATYLAFGDEPTEEQRKSTTAPEVTCLSLFSIHTAVGDTKIAKQIEMHHLQLHVLV